MKTFFVIQPQSVVDLITNSSAELFVFQGKEKHILEDLIKNVYSNYLDEYEPLKSSYDLTTNELDNFFNYYCNAGVYPATKDQYPIMPGFTFEELYDEEKESWDGNMQYNLKHDKNHRFVTNKNRIQILKKMDPNKQMYFLFSLDDNPSLDYQERLQLFGTRFHLG